MAITLILALLLEAALAALSCHRERKLSSFGGSLRLVLAGQDRIDDPVKVLVSD